MLGGKVMAKEPIKVFNEKSLKKCLKYWQKKLFLQDWIIKAKLCPVEDCDDIISGSGAINEMVFTNKSCLIRIGIISDEQRGNFLCKWYDEQVLVHELLHCKYAFMKGDGGTYEQVFLEMSEHQNLEELSKTLIMVKYNLPFDWFKNF